MRCFLVPALAAAMVLVGAAEYEAAVLPPWYVPWLAQVDGFRGATPDQAVSTACSWRAKDLASIKRGVVEALTTFGGRRSPNTAFAVYPSFDESHLRAAALLHTWAFMCVGRPGIDPTLAANTAGLAQPGLPTTSRGVFAVAESREYPLRRGAHLEIAHGILTTLRAVDPANDALHRLWHRVVLTLLAGQDRFLDARWIHRKYGDDVADDPDVLTLHATIAETLASPVVEGPEWSSDQRAADGLKRPALWRQAAGEYREAVRISPGLVEARLRLGRVLVQLGDVEGAVPELERAEREADTPRTAYLAALFLAGAHMEAARFDAAIAAYERALSHWPGVQSATIGRAQALAVSGRAGEGREQLLGLRRDPDPPESPTPNGLPDPWWTYVFGNTTNAARLILELRSWVNR